MAELSPFGIPTDYALESELQAPLPRPVPDRLRHHRVRLAAETRKRRWALGFLIFFALAWYFRETVPVVVAGLYVEPLAQLAWLGPLAVVGCALLAVPWPWKKDPFVYLRQGLPVVGRVVAIQIEVTQRVNGHDSTSAIDVYFEHLDPATHEPTVRRLRSKVMASSRALSVQMTCRVGDYVTAVYLPGQSDSMQLYGFTEINPDRALIKPAPPKRWKLALLLLALVFGTIWLPFAYPLSDGNESAFWWLTGAGALVGGVLGGTWHGRNLRRRAAAQQAAFEAGQPVAGLTVQQRRRWVFVLLGLMLGAGVVGSSLTGVNGFFDRGATTSVVVPVEDATVTSHWFIFNTYEARLGPPAPGSYSVNPITLITSPKALTLVTHPGALGWKWHELLPAT